MEQNEVFATGTSSVVTLAATSIVVVVDPAFSGFHRWPNLHFAKGLLEEEVLLVASLPSLQCYYYLFRLPKRSLMFQVWKRDLPFWLILLFPDGCGFLVRASFSQGGLRTGSCYLRDSRVERRQLVAQKMHQVTGRLQHWKVLSLLGCVESLHYWDRLADVVANWAKKPGSCSFAICRLLPLLPKLAKKLRNLSN